MEGTKWRIEAHIWFDDLDGYAAREGELLRLLERIPGEGSVSVFLRGTPEYIELPGASFDNKDKEKVMELVEFCGARNIDFVTRASLDTERELGVIRGRPERGTMVT